MNRIDAWTRRFALWTLPLVFCLLNLGGLLVYRAGFAGKVESLQDAFEARQAEKAALEEDRRATEQFLASVAARRTGMEELYGRHFSTEPERFTKAVDEIKRLARQAGFKAETINYPKRDIPDWGLEQRKFNFAAIGTYDQLRTFINFLEVTDHFITLDRVSLNESGGQGQSAILSIQFELSTIFVDTDDEAPATGRSSS